MSKRYLITARLIAAILVIGASAGTYILAAPAKAKPAAKKPPRPKPYKGIAVKFITTIAEGKPNEAIKAAKAKLVEMPGDLESLYSLAVAYSVLKQPDKAMEYVRQAVEAGLPFARFYAGPRNLLAPLTASKAFSNFAASHPVDLVHGPMLGAMTDTSVRIWVRCAAEMPVEVMASANPDMSSAVKSPVVKANASRDFTAIAELTGLKADTTYHYQVLLDGKPVKIGQAPAFRTFPAKGSKTKFQVVFGGGAGYTPQHERMWNTLDKHHPLAYLAMGDNVYIDRPKSPETSGNR